MKRRGRSLFLVGVSRQPQPQLSQGQEREREREEVSASDARDDDEDPFRRNARFQKTSPQSALEGKRGNLAKTGTRERLTSKNILWWLSPLSPIIQLYEGDCSHFKNRSSRRGPCQSPHFANCNPANGGWSEHLRRKWSVRFTERYYKFHETFYYIT